MTYQGTELYHWGILGQKWGERRYQYEDGTLTPEGKKRYKKETKITKNKKVKPKYYKKNLDKAKKNAEVQNKIFKYGKIAESIENIIRGERIYHPNLKINIGTGKSYVNKVSNYTIDSDGIINMRFKGE